MATYVERTAPAHEHYHESSGNSLGWVVGLIVVALLAWLIFAYGVPAISRGTNFSVSSQIDVNLNQRGAPAAPAAPAQ